MSEETKAPQEKPEKQRGLDAWHAAKTDEERREIVKAFPWLKHTISAAQNY